MSYDTIGTRGTNDWESTRTSSTGISSRTSKGTTTSNRSKWSKCFEGYSAIIWLKIVLVIITLIGGVILALLINVIGKRSGPKLSGSKVYFNLLDSVDESEKFGPIILCQFLNSESNLCLSGVIGDIARVDNCKDEDAQFFSVDDALTVKKGSKIGCGSLDKENVKIVDCEKRDLHQAWAYLTNHSFFHYKTKKCLTGSGLKAKDPVKLTKCIKASSQMWDCTKIYKADPESSKLVIIPLHGPK